MWLVWVSGFGEFCFLGGDRGEREFDWEKDERIVLICVCVCIGWNCYLSYVNSQGGKEKLDDVYEKEE